MLIAAIAALAAGCDAGLGVTEHAIVGGTIDSGDPAVVAIVPRRSRCEEMAPPVVAGQSADIEVYTTRGCSVCAGSAMHAVAAACR